MSNNKYISLNVANNGGGGGGGDIDSGAVLSIVNSAITDFSNDLQEGEPIVGMAKQLYSPDGVEVEGTFNIRTTGGDKDVNTGVAELRRVEGNSIYPELQYNDSAVLEREGEPVTGFTYDIEWGEMGDYEDVQRYTIFTGTYGTTIQKVRISDISADAQGKVVFEFTMETVNNTVIEPKIAYQNGTFSSDVSYVSATEDPNVFNIFYQGVDYGNIYIKDGWIYAETNTYFMRLNMTDGSLTAEYQVFVSNIIPNDIPAGESTYTYADATSAWTPSLPQAISNMQIDGVDYVPEDGDEITINRVPYRDSRAIFPAPTNFVSVGLNSFCASANTPISSLEKVEEEGTYEEDEIYVRAVPQTEYTIYSRIGLMPEMVGYGLIADAGTWKGQSGIYKNISIAPVPDAVKSAIEETGNNYNSTVFAHILSYRAEGEDDAYVDLILHPDSDGNIEVWDTNEETYLHLYDSDEEYWFSISIDGVETYVGIKWDAANRIISFYGADTEWAEPEDCYAIDFTMTTPIYKANLDDGEYDMTTGEPYHITVPEGFTHIYMRQSFDAEEEEKEEQKAALFGNLCVHPTWSGIKDEEYAEYTESKVPLQTLMIACPLWSIGSGETAHRNIIDLENGKLIRNITSEPYSAERVLWYLSHSYYIGGNFDFDSELIYVAQDPVITDVSIEDYKYEANDFSVEYLQKGNKVDDGKAVVDTYYMTNLVDKLRRMEGLVHLDSLSGTGSESVLYECGGKLFMWSDEGGAVAEWTDDLSVLGANNGYGLAFSHIPDGQTIFETRYRYDSDTEYRAFKMSGDTLVMYNTGGTVISACTVGEAKEMRVKANNSSYWVKTKVEKYWIGFEISNNLIFNNVWNGNVTGGHFVMVDHTNYPYIAITTDAGIAKWNSKGQITHKESGWSSKSIYFNTTGTSSTNTLGVLTNGVNNGPNRMFVPSQGGTSGQLLLSSGGGEPTWSNWIKSVQITSDEYEALATKDPNVLYLIVDE